MDDCISRAEAQTAIQFAAKRYTVAHEAHGEGQVVWSDNLINVTDAMNVLRDLPSTQIEPEAVSEWKKEFKEYIDSLDIARDDWKGIAEYIDDVPTVQPDTTTHDSIPAETGKNDGDRTSGDCISRQQAVDFVGSMNMCDEISNEAYEKLTSYLDELPSTQPETNCSDIPNNSDIISRQQAIDKFIDALEEIFSDIRERHVDESVCGLCEYDGAYIGQSGDWCNECPGFDRDDCFKLSDKTRKKWTDEITKALPSAQPDTTTHDSIPAKTGKNGEDRTTDDLISRQQAIYAVEKSMYENPHENSIIRGMHDHEHRHFLTILMGLPSIQPERKRGKWIERESDTEDKENGFKTVIVCTCCDFPATTFYSEDCESRTQIRTDFCPNCGAKMEKR